MPLEQYHRYYNHPEGKWIISWDDCERLQGYVREYKPKEILDLGSGIGASTYILAEASEDGKILAIEQSEKCIRVAKELMPSQFLSRITFEHHPAIVFQIDKMPFEYFSGFQDLPQGDWDMVIIDGPGFFISNGLLVKITNGDIFKLIQKMKEGCIVYIDGRKDTVAYLRRYIIHYFDVLGVDNDLQKGWVALRRNKVPYQGIIDWVYQNVKKTVYFNE